MPEIHAGKETGTLILPGLNGSGPGHWQDFWLNDQVGAKRVEQDNWSCPDLASWQRNLEAALERSADVWLVAHSLGCILAANLASSPLAARVRGALLVAPCHLANVEHMHPCMVNFGEMPTGLLPFPSLIVGSRNDPYMDYEIARLYADLWGSDIVDLGDAGHINIASGYGQWQGGYALLERLKSDAATWRKGRNRRVPVLPGAVDAGRSLPSQA